MRLSVILAVSSLGFTAAFSPSLSSSTRSSLSELRVSTLPYHYDPAAAAASSSHDGMNTHHDYHSDEAKMPPGVHAPVVEINSPLELAEFLNQDDRICVIKFHAAWCKSCQRMGLKYQGVANHKTDWISDGTGEVVQEGPVRFAAIEFGANSGICRRLGIKRLPTVQFYQKSKGTLAGFACGPKKFPLFQSTLEQFLEQKQQEDAFDTIMREGSDFVNNMAASTSNTGAAEQSSPAEVAGLLDELMAQDAAGNLESARTPKGGKKAKAWW